MRPTEPVISITYRKPSTAELRLEPAATGLVLSDQDVRLLRLLQALPILVQLRSPGGQTFTARVPAVLVSLQPRRDDGDWLMPAASLGALACSA